LTDEPTYPEVEKLMEAVHRFRISFRVLPRLPELDSVFYRRINVSLNGSEFELPVCDEYEDVDQGNPVVLLHLLLRELEYFEDADDYLVWCSDTGLKESPLSRQIWFEVREVCPEIRAHLGYDLKAISDFDFEMNTGVTKFLRSNHNLKG